MARDEKKAGVTPVAVREEGSQSEVCVGNITGNPDYSTIGLKDAIVRSIAAGATGYLQKYSGKEQLLTTLREVALGEFRIPGDAARRLARAVRSPSTDDASELLGTLTEREILKLFAGGLSYQEIGEVRQISALTVRNAVSGVQKKLGFKTRQQMMVWAVRAGLVDGGSA